MEVIMKRSDFEDVVLHEKRVESNGGDEQGGKVDELECAKAKMGEVREENERLKMLIARIVKDYESLQRQFFDIVDQQEEAKKPIRKEIEEHEFVSLSLGRDSSEAKKDDEKNKNPRKEKEDKEIKEGFVLGLDCKFEESIPGSIERVSNTSPDNRMEESKEEEAGQTWPPSKILKTMGGDDEVSQQTLVKKTRVSVRARCETPTMIDGCQWRKYGQKIAKGNPCPRAYYRCTVAPTCPVRKQVQRCFEDKSILITTYEGTHNHPLSISATAMASTTSAAASMLISGSSSSQQPFGTSAMTTSNLHGLNFTLSDNSGSKQFYLSKSSMLSSPSHPTITLDLTAPLSSPFSNFSPASKYSSTNFNFSTSQANNLPSYFSNIIYPNYGFHAYNQSQNGSLNFGRHPQELSYQSLIQKGNIIPPQESIEAATKAIASDPSFKSALAAAISSIISGVNDGGMHGNYHVNGENFGKNMKWGETFPAITSSSTAPNANGCVSSYLNS